MRCDMCMKIILLLVFFRTVTESRSLFFHQYNSDYCSDILEKYFLLFQTYLVAIKAQQLAKNSLHEFLD